MSEHWGFTITFPNVNYGTTQDEVTETTQATTQDLSQQDLALVELIKANPSISKSQIAEKMGWKKDNAGYHIQKLKEMGIIEHVGTSQNGHWEILKL